MKSLFRGVILIIIGLTLIACGQPVPVTLLPTRTAAATFTPVPSQEPASTAALTPQPEFVPPTLIPTLDPAVMPGLLSKAFSIRTIEGINGHEIKQITGWDYGFGGGMWQYSCPGYYWLDENHLLLYPQAGQRLEALVTDARLTIGVAPQSAVINLDNGAIWLPPVNAESMSNICDWIYRSPDLGILINTESHNDTSTVSTYTYDGYRLSSFPGGLQDVSPRGTKILLSDNTLIDVRANKTIKLSWSLEDYQEEMLSDVFWTTDETRLYRCCHFYADLAAGTSHRFERSDFQDANGNPLDYSGLWLYRGQWVRHDTYFLAQWSWIDDGDIRYLPMFDPDTKLFYDVREMAGIPDDWSSYQTTVSPDGTYLWMVGTQGSYLITLFTFDTEYFPGRTELDIDWSPNSRFVWLQNGTNEISQYYVLSAADKVVTSLPIAPLGNSVPHWWHPTDSAVVYPSEENRLIFLDASTMSYRALPFTLQEPLHDSSLAWSPDGKKLAFVAENGGIWRIDYPTLKSLEPLTPPLLNVSNLNWSPDGDSIAFINGSDIYVVEDD